MLYPVITPVALPGCYFPLIFTTHFLCMCLLCSLVLRLGWSVLVPLQFCCYELANTRLRGVVEFGVMWPSHGYSTTVSEQLFFFFYQSMGGGESLQCIPQSLWTAQCLSRPENALLSQGVCIPPIPVITAGGPGRGDQNLT